MLHVKLQVSSYKGSGSLISEQDMFPFDGLVNSGHWTAQSGINTDKLYKTMNSLTPVT